MEISNNLQEVLAVMVGSLNQGVAFLSDELPDVINQLLIWHSLKSGIIFITGVILLALSAKSVVWLKRGVKECRDAYDRGEQWTRYNGGNHLTSSEYDFKTGVHIWVIPVFLLVIGSYVVVNNIEWLQILIAPKVYLIEYSAKLAGFK